MEAFNDFWAKVKGSLKSGTMYFAAVIATFGGGALFLQYIQTDWLPMIQPLMTPATFGYFSLAVSMGIGYFRFKTITSLAYK